MVMEFGEVVQFISFRAGARADTFDAKFQKQAGSNTGGTKVRIRIPERANLEIFAGDKAEDKEGFIAWRDRLEMHLDTVWPG